MAKKTTLKEIAQLIGVSVSTVLKPLNDCLEISIETRNRVKEVALQKNCDNLDFSSTIFIQDRFMNQS